MLNHRDLLDLSINLTELFSTTRFREAMRSQKETTRIKCQQN